MQSSVSLRLAGQPKTFFSWGVYTFETDFVAYDLQKLIKEGTVFVVVQYLLLRVLAVFDVDDADLQLRLDKNLETIQ